MRKEAVNLPLLFFFKQARGISFVEVMLNNKRRCSIIYWNGKMKNNEGPLITATLHHSPGMLSQFAFD